MESIQADVLVIGAGAAGLRAALEAARAGASTLVVTKETAGAAGASAYGGAEAAGFGASGLVDASDGPRIHRDDILAAADGMADPELATLLALDAPRHLLALEALGVPFARTPDGSYLATRSCFSSRPRSIKIPGHGKPLVECLRRHLLTCPRVRLLEHAAVTGPLLDGEGRCGGAEALTPAGTVRLLAPATILAAGGAGRLFDTSLSPRDVTGDGYVFGLRAGAELVNLEFMQAGFAVLAPGGPGIFQYWLWHLAPSLAGGDGRSLDRYLPAGVPLPALMEAKARHFPFSVRDDSRFLEIAVQSFINDERDAGREGAVWLRLPEAEASLQGLPADHNLRRMWTLTAAFLRGLGLDLTQPFRIAPAAHAMNGGLVIDAFGRTTVEGLYAAGEAAGGPHGADRLGGNMFPAGQVFGERAGLHAAHAARRTRAAIPFTPAPPVAGAGAEPVGRLRQRLQRLASRALLVVREGSALRRLLGAIAEMEASADSSQDLAAAELRSLLLTGRAMASAALLREESRGGHYRADHPERRDAWTRRIFLRLDSRGDIVTRLG